MTLPRTPFWAILFSKKILLSPLQSIEIANLRIYILQPNQ